jgi:hypothetical protein
MDRIYKSPNFGLNNDYDDENLPSIPPTTPLIIERLVHSMLRKNPDEVPLKYD